MRACAVLFALWSPASALAQSAAIVYDLDPWGYSSNQDALSAAGIPHTAITTADLPTFDPYDYSMIIVASCQSDALYAAWNARLPDIEVWVADGGFLAIHACITSCNGGATTVPLPPGPAPTHVSTFENYGEVVGPVGHPMLVGVPPKPHGDFLAHDAYPVTGDPADVPLIVGHGTGSTLLFERPWGDGTIIYGGLTYEYGWWKGKHAGIALTNEATYGQGFAPDPCHDDDLDGWTTCDGDCDDADPAISPGAAEQICDGIDDDCDEATADWVDSDGDGVCETADVCPLDLLDDVDGDGVCDSDDVCPNGDDALDGDGDAVPDACDPCPLDLLDDVDGDGVCDSDDICPNGDDALDGDLDGLPDACDPCPLDLLDDVDGDGVCDSDDVCPNGDDALDGDLDGLPDACDECPTIFGVDSDDDGSCDADDCDDADPTVYPGAAEVLDDGIDQDCDGEDAVTPTPPGDTGDDTDTDTDDETETDTDDETETDTDDETDTDVEADDDLGPVDAPLKGGGGCDNTGGLGLGVGWLAALALVRRR